MPWRDPPVSDARRRNMAAVRAQDTKPELIVRRHLHAAGFRFRLHRRDILGHPDIVLPKFRAVVFVHGCFWHGHDCRYFRWPATRSEFWRKKIGANAARDEMVRRELTDDGWRVFSIWECTTRINDLAERSRALNIALGGLLRLQRDSIIKASSKTPPMKP